MSARDRILERVRDALATREAMSHPGSFQAWSADPLPPAVDAFTSAFQDAGGEVVRVADEAEAGAWLNGFSASFKTAAVGEGVPAALRPELPDAPPDLAEVGVSMARSAIGETGSLVLGAEDGRLTQLLPPTHVVWIREAEIRDTLREALAALKPTLPSALGLHSGPSKSADIGQVLVRGVHGPGRVVAVVIS